MYVCRGIRRTIKVININSAQTQLQPFCSFLWITVVAAEHNNNHFDHHKYFPSNWFLRWIFVWNFESFFKWVNYVENFKKTLEMFYWKRALGWQKLKMISIPLIYQLFKMILKYWGISKSSVSVCQGEASSLISWWRCR